MTKRIRRVGSLTNVLMIGLWGFPAFGQPARIKVEMQGGHVSPNIAKITYPSGATRSVTILGIGAVERSSYSTHAVELRDEAESSVTVWIDTIRHIQKANDETAVFVLKNGTERRLWFIDGVSSHDPGYRNRTLIVANDDGGQEKINLSRLTAVEFVAAPRKDKANNAMFEQWIYSPFTGERLPEK